MRKHEGGKGLNDESLNEMMTFLCTRRLLIAEWEAAYAAIQCKAREG